jgi:uncharacterized protein YwgA
MKGTEFLLLLIGNLDTTEGEARLQKLTYLAKTEYGCELPFEFTWSHYGPFSGEIQNYLKEMESAGLVKKAEYIMLTKKGKEEFSKMRKIFPSENECIGNLVERFGHKRIHDVLSYIYGRYMKLEEDSRVSNIS